MKIIVDNVKAILMDREDIVAGSIGVHDVEFHFDESWRGYHKTAVFKSGDECFEVGIGNIQVNVCTLPWQAIKESGNLQIGVRGQADGKTRPTLWSEAIPIHEGATVGAAIEPPSIKTAKRVSADLPATGCTIHYTILVDGEVKAVTETAKSVSFEAKNVVIGSYFVIESPKEISYCVDNGGAVYVSHERSLAVFRIDYNADDYYHAYTE